MTTLYIFHLPAIDELSVAAFQLFALYWGPGNLYPLVVFVLIHMFISAIVHTLFSGEFPFNIKLNALLYTGTGNGSAVSVPIKTIKSGHI
jgi:hypothetical protein